MDAEPGTAGGPEDEQPVSSRQHVPSGAQGLLPDITNKEIRELRQALLAGPSTNACLIGLVACHDALGQSHRRSKARTRCADLIKAIARTD
jgi:hypothetical protein